MKMTKGRKGISTDAWNGNKLQGVLVAPSICFLAHHQSELVKASHKKGNLHGPQGGNQQNDEKRRRDRLL